MSEQLQLGGPGRELADRTAKPLTARQQQAFDFVRSRTGVTADEVGAWLHAHRDKRPHGVDERCDWCARDGRSVLTSKALAPLVTYRNRDGARLYVVRDRKDAIRPVSSGVIAVSHHVPDDPFADL